MILENAVISEGNKWSKIASKYFPNRSLVEVRNRFISLEKKKSKNQEDKAEDHFEETKEEKDQDIFDSSFLERLKIDINHDFVNNSTFW
jgi:hypothetical protein